MVTVLKRSNGSPYYLCDYCEEKAFGSNNMHVVLEHEDSWHSSKEAEN